MSNRYGIPKHGWSDWRPEQDGPGPERWPESNYGGKLTSTVVALPSMEEVERYVPNEDYDPNELQRFMSVMRRWLKTTFVGDFHAVRLENDRYAIKLRPQDVYWMWSNNKNLWIDNNGEYNDRKYFPSKILSVVGHLNGVITVRDVESTSNRLHVLQSQSVSSFFIPDNEATDVTPYALYNLLYSGEALPDSQAHDRAGVPVEALKVFPLLGTSMISAAVKSLMDEFRDSRGKDGTVEDFMRLVLSSTKNTNVEDIYAFMFTRMFSLNPPSIEGFFALISSGLSYDETSEHIVAGVPWEHIPAMLEYEIDSDLVKSSFGL